MSSTKRTAEVFIVAAKRTPFGSFGGRLKNLSANLLGAIAAEAALSQLPKNLPIESVIFGNVAQTSNDAAYLARHVALRAGLPIHVPALTINRLCGSGFEAAALGALSIRAADANLVLIGGAENMSMSPYAVRNVRWGGPRYGKDLIGEDTLAAALVDRFPSPPIPMGNTAEKLAEMHSITRADCDEYALLSQKRYAAANEAGRFKEELVPILHPVGDKTQKQDKQPLLSKDEHPRADVTIDNLASLSPVFSRNGVVTAGNASGICDGAASLVLASKLAIETHSLIPLVSIRDSFSIGVDPSTMGIGPVPAIRAILKRNNLKIEDIGIFEVNEAFAAQYIAVERELGLDRNITNTNGGAIAMGHPLAASGARIISHLCYEMRRMNTRYGIGAACIGGGQGIAILLENCCDK